MITGATQLGDDRLLLTVDHDPRTTPTDCLSGSLIVYITTGEVFLKMDDGLTTNVTGDLNIKSNWTAVVDPTVNDDNTLFYQVGSFWVNTATGASFVNVDATTGAAVWLRIDSRGSLNGIGVSTLGNTAGNTGTTNGTYVLAGGNNITLSQATAAGSLATVTISGRDAVFGIGVSTGGNTLGATGTTIGTVVLEGIGNVTLSQSTAVGSQATIRISVGSAANANAIGVSTIGNTTGDTGTVTGTVVLVGGNGVTLSQATGTGGATITINGNATNLRLFSHNAEWISNWTVLNGTLSLVRITVPQLVVGTRMEMVLDLTGNSNSTGALTMSMGFYTMSGSTASLSTSGSQQISWTSGSATTVSTVYGGVSGTRFRTIGLNATLTPGDYLVGIHFRTTNNGTWRIFGRQGMSIVGALDTNETNVFLDGTSVSSFTTAMPASINVTDTNYARTGASALRQPGFIVAGTL